MYHSRAGFKMCIGIPYTVGGAVGAAATNDVQAGYLYLTATETTGNVWMLTDESMPKTGRVD